MGMIRTVVIAAVFIAACATAMRAGPKDWQGRRIYQVLTDRFALSPGKSQTCSNMNEYCGGTFNGLRDHLDYIADMGFNAIWISPVVVNTEGGYHGYWAKDFFKINPHFGTADELTAFIREAHAKDIWIMIDIVANHVGPIGEDYSKISPFNHSSHYHSPCQVTGYQCMSDETMVCRLADLPDLNQDNPYVKDQLHKWMHWLIDTFSFDGVRADTVMYIKQAFWSGLQQDIGTFIVGEVWSSFWCNQQYVKYGIDGTLNYPMYDAMRNVFLWNHNMRELGSGWREQLTLPNPKWEVNFLDNHDNDRFLHHTGNVARYKSAIAFMYFLTGIPCIYYGTEQHFTGGIGGNQCREPLWKSNFNRDADLYKFLKTLNAAYAEKGVVGGDMLERWQDDSMYCLVRGPMLLCVTNRDDEQTREIPNLPFAGKKVCNYFDQSSCVDGASKMKIKIPHGGMPLLLFGK